MSSKSIRNKLKRTELALQMAKKILEEKSRTLYLKNKQLLKLKCELEDKLDTVSKKVFELAKFPEQNPNPVIRVKFDGTLLYYNSVARNIIDFFSNDKKSISSDFNKILQPILDLNKSDKVRMLIKDSIFELFITPLQEEGYINIYANDITLTVIYENELISEKIRAEKYSKTKSQFLANMSHEIRTPLNGIIGVLSLLKNTPLNEDQQEYLDMVSQSGDFLLTIINEVLEFSKIESGKVELKPKEFNLSKLLKELGSVFSNSIYEKNLSLNIHFSNDAPEWIYEDESRIRQILINLVGNAIKFTDQGEISIHIQSQKEQLFIEVSDSGCGIPQHQIDTIFNAFTQSDNTDTRKHGGTGLGLSICKKIVTAMKGEITVKSIQNVGSTFIIKLPLTNSLKLKNKPCTDSMKTSSTKNNFQLNHIKKDNANTHILIVEDNLINQKVTQAMLKTNGYSFDFAMNGLEALEKLKARSYDLVLMDCQMPILDGFEATKQFRQYEQEKNLNETPIIAITASAFKETKNRCFDHKMTDFISKPLKSTDLIAIIEKHLSHKVCDE